MNDVRVDRDALTHEEIDAYRHRYGLGHRVHDSFFARLHASLAELTTARELLARWAETHGRFTDSLLARDTRAYLAPAEPEARKKGGPDWLRWAGSPAEPGDA